MSCVINHPLRLRPGKPPTCTPGGRIMMLRPRPSWIHDPEMICQLPTIGQEALNDLLERMDFELKDLLGNVLPLVCLHAPHA